MDFILCDLGNLSLISALIFSGYGVLSALLGAVRTENHLIQSAKNTVTVVWIFISFSVLALVIQILQDHFQIEYVAKYSNSALEWYYKVAALWGGQEGSLLFWSWILSTYAWLMTRLAGRSHRALLPYVTAIFMGTAFFFLLLNTIVANPFKELAVDHGSGPLFPYSPEDGKGLNPLLQYFAMLIHPPILYLGYIGTIAPFSFAMASLLAKAKSNDWIKSTRRWAIVSWSLLGLGIILGAKWAYVELGWGGYWAWDPVENASLLPWLSATAFLHSVMIQERKNMFKIWNIVLVSLTFILSIVGTFLTRSGIVNSVHSFAQSNIGIYFLSFIMILIVLTCAVIIKRYRYLKSDRHFESVVSREASFLLNNWILLAACFAVLWGTLFPVLSEMVQGEKITVAAPYFNKVNIPIGLILLFLTGVGPLLAWRKTSWESLRKNFSFPMITSLISGIILWILGVRHLYAWMTFTLSTFVCLTIFLEFYRGTRARMLSTKEQAHCALFHLVRKNAPRYGGYVIHLGIVLIFLGIAGNAFNQETKKDLSRGEVLTIKNYRLICKDIRDVSTPNYAAGIVELELYHKERFIKKLFPEKRFYRTSEQLSSEVAIHSTLIEDLYVVFSGISDDEKKSTIQVYLNPLVAWIWIGTGIVIFGTLIVLVPAPRPKKFSGAETSLRPQTSES